MIDVERLAAGQDSVASQGRSIQKPSAASQVFSRDPFSLTPAAPAISGESRLSSGDIDRRIDVWSSPHCQWAMPSRVWPVAAGPLQPNGNFSEKVRPTRGSEPETVEPAA